MAYVSINLRKAIEKTINNRKPTILIYTSDHGESPYSGRGHDSSRYTWEMSSVPFVIYINEVAKNKYPQLYDSIRELSTSRHPKSLSSFSDLILKIFDIGTVRFGGEEVKIALCEPKALLCSPKFRLVRKFINENGLLPNFVAEFPENYRNLSDDISTLNSVNKELKQKFGDDVTLCVHRANNLGRIVRGHAALGCIETDVVFDGEQFQVFHPPLKKTGLDLELVSSFIPGGSIWIDGKNIDTPKACDGIKKRIEAKKGANISWLIEFPLSSIDNNDVKNCISIIKKMGENTSLLIDTELARDCQMEVINNFQTDSCQKFEEFLMHVNSLNLFTDISFSFELVKAIKAVQTSRLFRWNTWHVPKAKLLDFNWANFHLIMPFFKDPNYI